MTGGEGWVRARPGAGGCPDSCLCWEDPRWRKIFHLEDNTKRISVKRDLEAVRSEV